MRQSLDGRHIPKHLLDDTPNPPMLKITFSQHVDLNVKFQSHRSRQALLFLVPPEPSCKDGGSFTGPLCTACACGTACSTNALPLSLMHRDYTNPYLPVAPFATDPGMLGLGIQAPISANPQEGNVLLAQVCWKVRIGFLEPRCVHVPESLLMLAVPAC